MVPYYQNRHERQSVGLDGPDLAGQRRRQLLAGARGTARDSIQQFDSQHFHVASQSRPGTYYEINLDQSTCNCPDFPRSRFCKHLAAINVHLPHLCPKESSPPIDLKIGGTSDPPQCAPISEIRRTSSPQESLQKLLQEIKLLSQQLDDKIVDLSDELAPAVMQAARSVKYSLTAAIASTQDSCAFPDKEKLPPNQNSWAETAARMGAKRRLPGEHGLTKRSISEPKPKRRCIYADPYASGERSGKLAKPDALSATANAHARAPPIPPPPNVLSPPPVFPLAPVPAACIPGPSTRFPWGVAPFPDPSAASAHTPGLRNALVFTPPFRARDPALGAAPFTSVPTSGAPVLARAHKIT